ncbi:putative alpha/beta hydrolase [Cladophialophora carrionii]|uniref:Putative alpha/beta hydrolase n=1 Tax=Cladophialophora carrionii TaxID=86049 RepID=A0A1C1D0S2_9EURO|nr:putative alpha/beta hydrolase [Cladophialophora carrionii]
MPQPYLLWVNSRPKPESGVDDDLWVKWYTEEHVPDLVNTKTAVRAAMYRETFDFPLAAKEHHPRKYLVLYQTDLEEPLKSKEYLDGVRHSSGLWTANKPTSEVGDFHARNYKLIQDYDPDGRGEVAPRFCLTVEMDPVDEADFHKWYQDEHLDMLHKLPGYRRSSRYVIGPKTALMDGEPPKYLAIHELDGLAGMDSKELHAANDTPWTVKHVNDSKVFIARAWELLYSQGF